MLTIRCGQVHYRVGKKIGEGSFGVIFEGTNLLNNQQVAIKFVCIAICPLKANADEQRNHGRAMHHSYAMSTGPTKYSLAAVSAEKNVK
jgi:serine/threonine protein kinase